MINFFESQAAQFAYKNRIKFINTQNDMAKEILFVLLEQKYPEHKAVDASFRLMNEFFDKAVKYRNDQQKEQ